MTLKVMTACAISVIGEAHRLTEPPTISHRMRHSLSSCNCIDNENDYRRNGCESSDNNNVNNSADPADRFANAVCIEGILKINYSHFC